jgi:hypothetical protein
MFAFHSGEKSSRTPFLVLGIVAAVAAIAPAAHAEMITGTITLTGTVNSTGDGPKKTYGQQYNGEYTITATYTIYTFVDEHGQTMFNPDGSVVTFTDQKKNYGPFNTLPIQITSVEGDLAAGDISSFMASATDWYANAPATLIQNGLTGSISSTTANITASYQFNYPTKMSPTTTLNYTFVAPVSNPQPLPNEYQLPPWDPVPQPAPEPSSLALLAIGGLGCGVVLRRRKAGKGDAPSPSSISRCGEQSISALFNS